jgi:hypothetical protein
MDINTFVCFNAAVWGNVSDWVMVLVTASTLYLLWRNLVTQNKTLLSQLSVQKLQQQITAIEMTRHRLELLPVFKLTAIDVDSESEDPEDNVAKFITFKFLLEANTCSNLVLNIGTKPWGFEITNDLPITYNFVNVNTDIGLFGKFTTRSFEDSDHIWACNVYFELLYSDALANEYRQIISYTLKDDGVEIDNQDPVLITDAPNL